MGDEANAGTGATDTGQRGLEGQARALCVFDTPSFFPCKKGRGGLHEAQGFLAPLDARSCLEKENPGEQGPELLSGRGLGPDRK